MRLTVEQERAAEKVLLSVLVRPRTARCFCCGRFIRGQQDGICAGCTQEEGERSVCLP